MGLLYGDRGFMPLGKVSVSIYEPGQHCAIFYNGKEEIIILKTEMEASEKTKVLEILPLPSKPHIKKADPEIFQLIEEEIMYHRPIIMKRKNGDKEKGIEILEHKKIGPHDITVIKCKELNDFHKWVKEFSKENKFSLNTERIETLIERYILKGYNYFALDMVSLDKEKRSIIPIEYRFSSPFLYYPLEISSSAMGYGRINLYIFVDKIPVRLNFSPLKISTYTAGGSEVPIIFHTREEIWKNMPKHIKRFFKESPLFFSLEWEGKIENLRGDIELKY